MELVQKLTWLLACSIFVIAGTGCKETTLEEKDGWYDTQADSSLVEDPSLFDLTDFDGEKVLRANTDGVDIHSHYLGNTLSATACEYTGSFYLGNSNGGMGVTFASSYPDADAYYRFKAYGGSNLRLDSHPKNTKPSPIGSLNSNVPLNPGQWYQFRVRWMDAGNQTEIFAKAWPKGSAEPAQWQVEAQDSDASRYTNCRIGVWASHANGQSYWNQLELKEVTVSVSPTITSEPAISVDEGELYEYQIAATPSASYNYSVESSSENVTLNSSGLLTWQHEPELVAPLTGPNPNCEASVDGTGQFDPVEKWHWNQGQVRITPMVGQLSDDNDDGVINTLDTPDIVFTAHEGSDRTSARMVVLSGDNGTELPGFVVPGEVFHSYAHLALGDIDNDGVVEIVTTTADRKIVAYEHTGGSPKWIRDLPSGMGIRTTPALYDLNGDGSVEILMGKYVFDANGVLQWAGSGQSVGAIGTLSSDHHNSADHGTNEDFTSFAMEFIESSPGLEVIVGNQVYSSVGGQPIWTAESIGDGASAMGDVDGDGDPELVIVSNKSKSFGVVDHMGNRVWEHTISDDDDLAGPPTLSDINGDGKLEIGFVTEQKYYAYSHAGDKLWELPINDRSSGITGSTVFDFEGDGKADIVYFDEDYLRVFDELGNVKFQIANNSGTWIEYPVIADIDNDGHADILIPSSDSSDTQGSANTTRGVRAFKDRYNTWPATRPVWNQHAYHIDNVNDDGTIPATPALSYQTHNTFRLSSFEYGGGQTRVDFTLSKLRLEPAGNGYDLLVDVVNRTDIAASQLNISFYHGDPIYEELIGRVHLPAISASETQTVKLDNVDTTNWDRHIQAKIEYNGRIPECLNTNNEIIGAYFNINVTNSGANAFQEFIVTVDNSNLAPRLAANDPFTVEAGSEFAFQVNATDPDVGDQLRYFLVNKPSDAMRIDPNTGAINWVTTPADIGSHTFRVRVEDSEGLSDEADYSLDVILNQGEPPVITSIPLRTAYQQIPYEYQVIATDENVESLMFTAPVKPPGMSITPAGLITWTPSDMQSGPFDLTVRVTDQTGLSDEQAFSVDVKVPDSAQRISFESSPGESAIVGENYVYRAQASTTSGTDIRYSLPVAPVEMSIDPVTGEINWTPEAEDVGLNPVVVKATDGIFKSAEQRYEILVSDQGFGGELRITSTPDLRVHESRVFQYQLTANQPIESLQMNVESGTDATLDTNGLFLWTPDPKYIAPLELANLDCRPDRTLLQNEIVPVIKWQYRGGAVSTPAVVAQFNDDNGDGFINDLDVADILVMAFPSNELLEDAWIEVIDGRNGEPLSEFVKPDLRFYGLTHLAVADINNDGEIEIITTTLDRHIIALSRTGGEPIWRKPIVESPGAIRYAHGVANIPVVADLEEDGDLEIIMGRHVYSAVDGSHKWSGTAYPVGSLEGCSGIICLQDGLIPNHNDFATVADINGEPGLEVMVGGSIYAANGEIIFANNGDGFVSVADLDLDGSADILHSNFNHNQIYVRNPDGSDKFNVSTLGMGGSPAIGNLDGDPELEFVVASLNAIRAFDHAGVLLWENRQINDSNSGLGGPTIFDINSDGKSEVLYADMDKFYIFDHQGEIIFQSERDSGTWYEYPVVADLDNDNSAEIILVSNEGDQKGVTVYFDPNQAWSDAPAIWNQHQYYISNINEDGTIPQSPPSIWSTHNSYRAVGFQSHDAGDKLDLSVGLISLERETGSVMKITAEVRNQSNIGSDAPILIDFLAGDESESPLLDTVILDSIEAGAVRNVSLLIPVEQVPQEIGIHIRNTSTSTECISDNNFKVVPAFKVMVTNTQSESDSQWFVVNVDQDNELPEIQVTQVPQGETGAFFTYQIQVTDPDQGDRHVFELDQAPDGMWIASHTGLISWYPKSNQFGVHSFTVRVTDASGYSDSQVFEVEVIPGSAQNQPPYFSGDNVFYTEYNNNLQAQIFGHDPEGGDVIYRVIERNGPSRLDQNTGDLTSYSSVPRLVTFKVQIEEPEGLTAERTYYIWHTASPVADENPPEVIENLQSMIFVANVPNQLALPLPDGAEGYQYVRKTYRPSLTVADNILTWTPSDYYIGLNDIDVTLTNGTYSYDVRIQIEVRANANTPPNVEASGPPALAYVDVLYEHQFRFVDADGDALSVDIANPSPTMSVTNDGLFRWTPTTSEVGSRVVTFRISDGYATLNHNVFLEVLRFPNLPPRFDETTYPLYATLGQRYELKTRARDPDGDPIVYSLESGIPGMTVDPESGLLVIENVSAPEGMYRVQVDATDPRGNKGHLFMDIEVSENLMAVVINVPKTDAFVGKTYRYGLRAYDPEGKNLSLRLGDNVPPGMTLSGWTLRWTPVEEDIGVHPVTILIDDEWGATREFSYNLTVYADEIWGRKVCPAPGTIQ